MLANTKKYLVVLDWDGTVTRLPYLLYSTWGSMNLHLLDKKGVSFTQELREHMLSLKKRDMLTAHHYRVWFELSVSAWITRGLNLFHINSVFGSCEENLRPGFVDFLRWLKEEREGIEISVVINSYGLVQFIETALEGIGARTFIDHIAATPLLVSDDGLVTGWDRNKILLPDDKWNATGAMMSKFGAPLEHTVGIGDSSGDRQIARRRLLLAFDQEQVDTYAHHFEDHVISEDWSGPRAWLEETFGF